MKKFYYLILSILIISSCTSEIKEITEKYPDNSPKVVSFFIKKNDVKIKVREIGYYQNQQENYKGKFKNGIKAGEWKYFYENGKLFAKTEITSTINTQKWEILKPDQTPYIDNSYQLSVVEIYPNGAPNHCIYKKTTENSSLEIFFYPNYKLQMQGSKLNDKREGNWNYWYENGNKWSEGYFKGGISDSIRNVWYENGNKRYEGLYDLGKEVGVWKFYEENGKLAKEVNYDKENLKK